MKFNSNNTNSEKITNWKNIINVLLRLQDEFHEGPLSIYYEGSILLCGYMVDVCIIEAPYFLMSGCNNSQYSFIIQPHKKMKSESSRSMRASTPARSSKTSGSDADTFANISGAPLESPFAITESENIFSAIALNENNDEGLTKRHFEGFPIKEARTIFSEIINALRYSPESEIIESPVYVACDGLNPQGIVFFGIDGKKYRITASCSKPFDDIDRIPSIDHLVSNFYLGSSSNDIDTSCNSKYIILSKTDHLSCSIYISFSWKRPLSTFCPPSLDADAKIDCLVSRADPENAAHCMFLELSVLESLINGFKAGKIEWIVCNENVNITSKLDNLFEKINEPDGIKKDCHIDAFSRLIESGFSNIRYNLDFGDLIWTVLKSCESYEELQFAFSHVFKAVSSNVIQPFIHILDKTCVANICRKLIRGESNYEEMKDIEPLKMLIEIGLEKMKRDYISIFQSADLATMDQLDAFASWESWNCDWSDCLHKLKQLDSALHCIVLLKKFFNIPQIILANYTTEIFSKILQEKILPSRFSFSIKTLLLQKHFANTTPTEWILNISNKENEEFSKVMKYYVTKEPLFFKSNDDELTRLKELPVYYGFSLSVLPDTNYPPVDH